MQAEIAEALKGLNEGQTVFVKYLVPSVISGGKPQERWVDLQIARIAPEALYGRGFRAGAKVDWHLRSKEGKTQIRIENGPWWTVASVDVYPMRLENQR